MVETKQEKKETSVFQVPEEISDPWVVWLIPLFLVVFVALPSSTSL